MINPIFDTKGIGVEAGSKAVLVMFGLELALSEDAELGLEFELELLAVEMGGPVVVVEGWMSNVAALLGNPDSVVIWTLR